MAAILSPCSVYVHACVSDLDFFLSFLRISAMNSMSLFSCGTHKNTAALTALNSMLVSYSAVTDFQSMENIDGINTAISTVAVLAVCL